MTHCIIVKWKPELDKASLLAQVTELYRKAEEMPIVSQVRIVPNVIARDNRYDLCIALDMAVADLPMWDQSELHHEWKNTFGAMIDKKAIFDFEL